jgi:enamine deaminase RidA (YjgF/YER057c/UK114 family)
MSERFSEGTSFEAAGGYSRAVRRGPFVAVSATAAQGEDGVYAQTHAALTRAITAVEHVGGTAEDIVRSRLYVKAGEDWRGAAEAHRELLGDVAPANAAFFVAGFPPEDALVEVELDAILLE